MVADGGWDGAVDSLLRPFFEPSNCAQLKHEPILVNGREQRKGVYGGIERKGKSEGGNNEKERVR